MKHSVNPRYKICFQTKNKVWIYKNSRLRNFYKIRHKIVLKTGRFSKKYLITKNMKWTVARRQMVPYFRKKNRFSYNYKNLFFTKQQLKNFYGGLKEYEMRNIFKRTWNTKNMFRCNSFLGGLEQRLSMVLFRMRFLPTIFSCHQYIKHKGILVNNILITIPTSCVKIGDFVSINSDQWFLFYKFLFERIQNRFFGQGLLVWRKNFLLNKILSIRYKNKQKYIQNFKLLKLFKIEKEKFDLIKKFLINTYKSLFKKKKEIILIKNLKNFQLFRINWKLNSLKILSAHFYSNIFVKLKKVRKHLKYLRKWKNQLYNFKINQIVFEIVNVKYLMRNFISFFLEMLFSWFSYDMIMFSIINEKQNYYLNENFTILSQKINFLLENRLEPLIETRNWHSFSFKRIKNRLEMRLKKVKHFRIYSIKNKRFLNYKLRKLKRKRFKKNLFKHWCKKSHLFIPQYLEMDLNTLRASFIKHPEINEVFFGFINTFKKIISFYKERAL